MLHVLFTHYCTPLISVTKVSPYSALGAIPCQPAWPSISATPLPFTVCITIQVGPSVKALADSIAL